MFSKSPKSHQTFGLLLKDNLPPRTLKIAQSRHTAHRSGSVEDFKHAVLAVHFHLFAVRVFDRWIVFFDENALKQKCLKYSTTAAFRN